MVERLIEKSKESFILAIEIFNKPTIRYRAEGFAMLICNAWELMLKAHLIKTKGENSIYYKENPDRTITLRNCIKKIFTNDKDPLRINLEKINELRDTSTHFITEEYEMIYFPLFQACVLNYKEKLFSFHKVDIIKYIPKNFLFLSINLKPFDEAVIRASYPKEIAEKMLSIKNSINSLEKSNNSAFAIQVEHNHYLTKYANQDAAKIKIDNDNGAPVRIIKELKDPNKTHKFSTKACIEKIRAELEKENIILPEGKPFNNYHFQLFVNCFKLKEQERYCFALKVRKAVTYCYSIHTINFIVSEIKKKPDIIWDLKRRIEKNKKS